VTYDSNTPVEELIAALLKMRETALSDSYGIEGEYNLSAQEEASMERHRQALETVIDEVIQRLRVGPRGGTE
jgi:hypothetical protein